MALEWLELFQIMGMFDVENQDSYDWVEVGNTFEDWHFNACEGSHAVFLVRDQLKRLSLGQASINVTRSTKLAK